MISEGCAAKGSSVAVARSGSSSMSDSLIAFQPAIDEPSNMTPSVSRSSSTACTAWARCCHLPRGSVKRKSTYFTSCSLISEKIFAVSAMMGFLDASNDAGAPDRRPLFIVALRGRSNRFGTALAGADADRFVDGADEDLAVADPPGAGGLLNGLDGALHQIVLEHDLDLHLGQEVDDVLGATVELGMAL